MIIKQKGDALLIINSVVERQQMADAYVPPCDPCGNWLLEVIVKHRLEYFEKHNKMPEMCFVVAISK